jgi:hypothetical protein
MSGHHHALAALIPRGRTPVPTGWEAGYALEPVWTLWSTGKPYQQTGSATLAVQPVAVPTELSLPYNNTAATITEKLSKA